MRILTVVLRVCEYVSGLFELCSEFCVFVCVWPHAYGDDECSCICGALVCVLYCVWYKPGCVPRGGARVRSWSI